MYRKHITLSANGSPMHIDPSLFPNGQRRRRYVKHIIATFFKCLLTHTTPRLPVHEPSWLRYISVLCHIHCSMLRSTYCSNFRFTCILWLLMQGQTPDLCASLCALGQTACMHLFWPDVLPELQLLDFDVQVTRHSASHSAAP